MYRCLARLSVLRDFLLLLRLLSGRQFFSGPAFMPDETRLRKKNPALVRPAAGFGLQTLAGLGRACLM
ncbi:hypothetical protein [Polaromonas naphthalenivorans]|uniref:hypothetical protein n=1 Tax=Polaromonas naphthalenivorans TaxID=216465 RepID=UPI0012ED7AB1|nr:hypothetical protein [Polaromonas naphthalenivorans]